MISLPSKTAPMLLLALITISQPTSFAHPNAITTPLKGFKTIKVAPGLATADQLIDTVRPFLVNHPESLEGRPSLSMTVNKKANGFVINILKKGYLDDSVRGEHLQGFVVRTSNGKWELISMMVKNICYRGKSQSGQCL